MSVSSNSRKESTESYAAQEMHSTMGTPPGLAQLNDKNLDNDLPSRVADSSDTDVPGDYQEIETLSGQAGESQPTDAELEEARRASWGQPPLPADADDAAADEENPMTAYQQPVDNSNLDANGNQKTAEGAFPATRANEPDRKPGNS